METAKQLSVSLVNKPGRLAAMLAGLSKGKVTLRALAVMDSGDRGTVRFVPDDVDAAGLILKNLGVTSQTTNVLLVDVPRHVGAFRSICERLAAEHINIDYAYSSLTERGAKGGLAVFKVNNIAKAQQLLSENGGNAARRQIPTRRPLHTR